jgi:hypothetical protein
MELEFNADFMMPEQGVHPRRALTEGQALKAAISFPAAPMVFSFSGQKGVPERELSLGDIPSDKVRDRCRERLL